MNLQTIKSMDGKIEYVLLPFAVYQALCPHITAQLKEIKEEPIYEAFDPTDYIDNPIALARIQAGITQKELAKRMHVTQAYVSKIENQEKITAKMMQKVTKAMECK